MAGRSIELTVVDVFANTEKYQNKPFGWHVEPNHSRVVQVASPVAIGMRDLVSVDNFLFQVY